MRNDGIMMEDDVLVEDHVLVEDDVLLEDDTPMEDDVLEVAAPGGHIQTRREGRRPRGAAGTHGACSTTMTPRGHRRH